jgi:hypothetical protein
MLNDIKKMFLLNMLKKKEEKSFDLHIDEHQRLAYEGDMGLVKPEPEFKTLEIVEKVQDLEEFEKLLKLKMLEEL